MKKMIFAEILSWFNSCKVGSHKYASRFLSDGYQLCWVSHPISPLHFFKKKYINIFLNEFIKDTNLHHLTNNNLRLMRPFTVLPYTHINILDSYSICRNTLKYTIPNFKNRLIKNQFSEVDLIWMTNIHLLGLLNFVKYKKLIFRIADNIIAFPGAPNSSKEVTKYLINKADIVFCASQNLTSILSNKYRKRIIYLPNGVDFETFRYQKGQTKPIELKNIKKPIVIYIGMISEWFDVDLVYYICKKSSNLHFIFIGPVEIDLRKIADLENVSILGPRPHNTLPRYMHSAQIGIIPFKKNLMTDFIHPIKLYEYCAAGLSVVSTDLKETRSIHSPALIVDSYSEFYDAVQSLAKERIDPNVAIAFGEKNSWDARFRQVKEIIEDDKSVSESTLL